MLFYFLIVEIVAISALPIDYEAQMKAMVYLDRYGYLAAARKPGKSALLLDEGTITRSLTDFQQFIGINVTGILDKETIEMMNRPRCGVPDRIIRPYTRRRKRYTLFGSKFSHRNVTYSIDKYPQKTKADDKVVDMAFAMGFKVWSDKSALTFTQVKGNQSDSSISIRFEVGAHPGDSSPFNPSIFAHAKPPSDDKSWIHFDDDKNWKVEDPSSAPGAIMPYVAAHEIGHSMGLGHSNYKGSVMQPYVPSSPETKLSVDDIRGIRFLYGKPAVRDPTEPPDLCEDPTIDAITRTEDGSTYVFKGNYYWRLLPTGLEDSYPSTIGPDWGGLPGDLDAAITWPDGRTFFFKEDQFWEFRNKTMASGFPQPISTGFVGIPNGLDAATYWTGDRTFFFKDAEFFVFDHRDHGGNETIPTPISQWKGMPEDIDASFLCENITYFFKGNDYYILQEPVFLKRDDGSDSQTVDVTSTAERQVDTRPRSTAVDLFGCKSIPNTQGGVGIKISKQPPRKYHGAFAISEAGCERNMASLLSMTLILCVRCLLE